MSKLTNVLKIVAIASLAFAFNGCATRHGPPAPTYKLFDQKEPVEKEYYRAPSGPALEEGTGEEQGLMELPGSAGVEWIPNGLSISLKTQHMCHFKNGVPIHCADISSGKRGYRTVTGEFKVQSKSRMVLSSKYPNAAGEPAEMPWSLCFFNSYCIHAGYLPGYPDSHGCVRTRRKDAKLFFDHTQVGDPVLITNRK